MTSNTPETQAPFEREGRYVILKIKRLTTDQLEGIRGWMHVNQVKGVDAVVVEADWPEYETVWQMIEDRVTGRHRQSSSNAGGVETLESIVAWGDETFGPCSQDRAIERAWEEWQEMLEKGADVPIEAADVIICLLRIPGILDAINRKMTINRGRTWDVRPDGTGYHVKTAALASLSTPTAEPTGIERSKVVMLERYLRRARGILGSKPSKLADDIDAYFSGNALTPPTPDRIGKDAVREALLDQPFANTAPIEWGDYEWHSLASALSATPAQEGE